MGMKKKLVAALIVCLAISSLLFAVLWQRAENSKDDIRQLAQASAADAVHNLSSIRRMEKQAVIGMASLHSGLLNKHIIC